MKQIWPEKTTSTSLSNNTEKQVTEQQYIDLVNKVNEAECCVSLIEDELDTHIASQAVSVTTADLTATNSNVCHITSNTVNTSSIVADTANVETATVGTVNVDTVNAGCVTSDAITVQCGVSADSVEANSACFTELTVECAFNPSVVNTTRVCATNATLDCACITDTLKADYINADTAFIDNLNSSAVGTDELNATCAVITEATVTNATVNCADIQYITHKNNPQHISELEEFWIVLPKFTNGEYFLEARNDTDVKLWSIEVDNSQANIRFKWSNNRIPYIKDVEIVSDVNEEFLQIHVETLGEEVTLYSQSISLENTLPPSIYGSRQYDTGKDFDITSLAGTYMPNAVFAGDFHAESIEFDETVIDCIGIGCQIRLPTAKDAYGDNVNWSEGNNNAYVTNVTDEYDRKYAKWVDPACAVERCNQKLITSDAVSVYDGKVQVGVDAEDNPVYEYPIKELNCATTVHGTLTSESVVVTKDFCTSNITDIAEDVDAGICASLSLNNPVRTSDGCVYTPTGTLADGKPVVYNCECDTLETTDSLSVDTLNVATLSADKAFIKEMDVVKEETISSTSNYVALRANNESAMVSGETAGVLINNYDGNGKDSAIVADNNGIVKVGTGTPTRTTYPTLYFNKDDSKYYTDIEDPTSEVSPSGALTRWDSVEDTTDYIKWINAVFSVIDFTKTTTTNYVKIGSVYYDYNIVEAATTPAGTETEGHIVDSVYGIADYDEYTTGVVKSYNDAVYVLLTKSNEDRTVVEVTGVDDISYTGTVTLDDELYEEIYDNGTTLLDNGPFNLGTLTSFSVTESTLEPLTTRADSVDMNNQGLTKWNNTGKKIDTISLPTVSEQILTSVVENGAVTYSWANKPSGVYRFASITCYNAYTGNIPENSIVIIDEENNYLMGDNK